MPRRNKEPKPRYDFGEALYLTGPPNPDPISERSPEDLAERASLLDSEDFFRLTGMAMGQVPVPEGTTIEELAAEASERAKARPDPLA